MSPPMQKPKTPGVYKRGGRYVVVYRDPSGNQRKRFAKTLAEARDLKASLRADVARGEYRQLSGVTFAEYAVLTQQRSPQLRPRGLQTSPIFFRTVAGSARRTPVLRTWM